MAKLVCGNHRGDFLLINDTRTSTLSVVVTPPWCTEILVISLSSSDLCLRSTSHSLLSFCRKKFVLIVIAHRVVHILYLLNVPYTLQIYCSCCKQLENRLMFIMEKLLTKQYCDILFKAHCQITKHLLWSCITTVRH